MRLQAGQGRAWCWQRQREGGDFRGGEVRVHPRRAGSGSRTRPPVTPSLPPLQPGRSLHSSWTSGGSSILWAFAPAAASTRNSPRHVAWLPPSRPLSLSSEALERLFPTTPCMVGLSPSWCSGTCHALFPLLSTPSPSLESELQEAQAVSLWLLHRQGLAQYLLAAGVLGKRRKERRMELVSWDLKEVVLSHTRPACSRNSAVHVYCLSPACCYFHHPQLILF